MHSVRRSCQAGPNFETWTDAGRPTTYDHDNRVCKEALAAYEQPALAPAIEEELAVSSPAEGKREGWKLISGPPEKAAVPPAFGRNAVYRLSLHRQTQPEADRS
jgi:hypothetical protein